ncbi:hypothetical protein MASR2M66_09580 [Chloroflexota bacterium]
MQMRGHVVHIGRYSMTIRELSQGNFLSHMAYWNLKSTTASPLNVFYIKFTLDYNTFT